MKRILPLIVFAFLATPALGDELLCEFWYRGLTGGNTNVAPTAMEFSVSLPTGPTLNAWMDTYTPAQIGQTFDMPLATVAGWQAVINNPPAGGPWWYASDDIPGVVSNAPPGSGPLDANPVYPYTTATGAADLTMFVPRSAWPHLTRITRTIDELALNFTGTFVSGSGRQTIRLYGSNVPEPSSLLLIAIGFAILAARHR